MWETKSATHAFIKYRTQTFEGETYEKKLESMLHNIALIDGEKVSLDDKLVIEFHHKIANMRVPVGIAHDIVSGKGFLLHKQLYEALNKEDTWVKLVTRLSLPYN